MQNYELMQRSVVGGLVLLFILVSCGKEVVKPEFLISKAQIGLLTPKTTLKQIQSVFKTDSVVNENTSPYFSNGNEVVVYGNEGQVLLRLTPKIKFDSTSTITRVDVVDTLFKTEAGLGIGSPFELLKTNYKISRIENILGAVLVFVDEMNFYVSIDKNDVLKPNKLGERIKVSQIKDEAKIEHMWLTW